jgi:hypothetical protein
MRAMTIENRLPRDYQDFSRARRKAFWHEILSFVSRRPSRLLSWDEVHDTLGVTGNHYRGPQSVPVEQIVGSVGRYQDFDSAFLPAKDTLERRWRSIARAHYQATNLPPVELYKAGDAYFCVDGHHRVSVAKQRKIKFIEAHVVEVETRVPVSEHLDAAELEVKGEYVRFLDHTRLDKLRPDQRIEFTTAGGYDRLLEHIGLHRYTISQQGGTLVPEQEATCDWYDHVYQPIVQFIRTHEILADFPHRTEADLYLWIVDHQHYLQEQCGPGVILEQVAAHFAERHSGRLLKRATNTVREWFGDADCQLVTQGNDHPQENTN